MLPTGTSAFDYGCGRGSDVRHLSRLGLVAHGWDPAFAPHEPQRPADLVNLGFVLNVIEDIQERAAALRSAWVLARRILIVSARLDWEDRALKGRPHLDGRVTAKGTFQKLYRQDELGA
jgi:DNA phosphorothioation-associated putative methyltransferase